MQNKQIIQLIERIVERRLLKEAFQSDLMRQLNQYSVPKLAGRGRRQSIEDGKSVVQFLTGLSINASEVTDGQIVKQASGGIQYSKNNPDAAVIIVNDKSKQVQAVIHGTKHVRLSAQIGHYPTSKDPKYDWKKDKYQNVDQFTMTGARTTDSRPSLSDKTGKSSIESMSAAELNALPFFAISNASPSRRSGFNDDYNNSQQAILSALTLQHQKYAAKIKEMRAEKRADDSYPDELIQLGNRLLTAGQKMKTSLMDAIDNPTTRYPGSNKVVTYGQGRNSRSYYTSYIDMYRETIKYIADLEDVYKSGKDWKKDTYYYGSVINNIKDLEKAFK